MKANTNQRPARRLGARSGQSMIEGALVFLTFFMVILGIFEYGRIIWMFNMMANAAREGTRYAIARGANAHPQATADDITTVVRRQMVGMDPSSVNVAVAWNPNNKPGSTVNVTVTCSIIPVFWFLPSSIPLRSRSEMVIFY